jgi:hypothetical protein
MRTSKIIVRAGPDDKTYDERRVDDARDGGDLPGRFDACKNDDECEGY